MFVRHGSFIDRSLTWAGWAERRLAAASGRIQKERGVKQSRAVLPTAIFQCQISRIWHSKIEFGIIFKSGIILAFLRF